jgi:hypothetical protein
MATGLKITQRGTDLERAADYQTVLDSRWPLVEYRDYFVDRVVPSGGSMAVYEHKLGYAPGWEFMVDTGFDDASLGYTDKTTFYTSATGVSQHIKGRLRLYLTDLAVNYKADTLTISPELDQGEEPIGIKIIDETEASANMRKPDFNYYTLNTNAKAMSIHMSGAQPVDGGTNFANVTHGLGYLPTFMAWQTNSTITEISQISTFSFANTATLSFRGVQSILTGSVAYLILKDPLVVAV